MVQNAFVGVDLFLHDNLAHDGGEGNGELVRLVPAKRIRQITLCVRIYKQYLLSLSYKPYAEIGGGCNITTSLLGSVKLMALVMWLSSLMFLNMKRAACITANGPVIRYCL